MAMQEAHKPNSLIGANKVERTPVFNRSGEELGRIHEIMIDKHTGNVAYAVMSFGGVFGVGEKYCPLPWSTLSYDTDFQGYVADLSKEALKNAAAYDPQNPPWSAAYEGRLLQYYAAPSDRWAPSDR
jgi:PRC-barrel domain